MLTLILMWLENGILLTSACEVCNEIRVESFLLLLENFLRVICKGMQVLELGSAQILEYLGVVKPIFSHIVVCTSDL